MARYIALLKFTEQGAKNIKKSTQRAHAFDKLAAKAGVKVEGQYWTMGRFDGVLILSASDETKVLHMLTSLVSAENGRSAVVAMRPERFERDDAVSHFLRHEFMHLGDMLDPTFGYTPDLRARGLNPSHQRIVRERYRLLWDITIDGRLGRSSESVRHRALFDSAFSFWPEAQRGDVFSRLWTRKAPRHDELLSLASDPRHLSHANRPLPGGSCPLCGFSTFEWADIAELDNAIRTTIEREFPGWSPAQGACSRCAEVYASASHCYAHAIPQ